MCPVGRPIEKGHGETLVGSARGRFLVPLPTDHAGPAALNTALEQPGRDDLSRRLWGKPVPTTEFPDLERASILPPAAARIRKWVAVSTPELAAYSGLMARLES